MATDSTLCDPADLVPLMQAGDLAALDRITRCFGDRLAQVGRRYCRTPSEADDAVQDALLAAGAHMRAFRGEGSPEGWLVRMVINACHHMRRGRKNDPRMHDAEAVLVADEGSPEERAMTGELSQALGEALLELKPIDRTIVLLSEGEGWTGPEIAEKLQLSPGAVRTRLTRARQRLRAHLGERLG
jgi:RNA polymerase sigma-70 factor, ECF subfamily